MCSVLPEHNSSKQSCTSHVTQDGLCKGFFPFVFLFIYQSEEKRITTISGTKNDRVGETFIRSLGTRDFVLCAQGNILG